MKNFLLIILCLLPVLSVAQTQIGTDIDGKAAGDRSGWSVSLSADGTIVAIGAPFHDGSGNDAGHVRVYQNIAGTWTQVGADIDGEAALDLSGTSVSLSSDGTVVAIGAPGNDRNGNNAGHVRVYQNIAGTWTQVGADIDGEAAGDGSGRSVSLSLDGTVVAIGAFENDGNGNNAGHVRVYQNIAGTWTQVGADINGVAAVDRSGFSVSLSSDGTVVAIGAPGNDGNGNIAGHVRVFKNNSGTWTQVGADIDGEAAGDQSGHSVSLSADGSVVAIGAIGNDGNPIYANHVRVYQNIAGTWTQIGADIKGEAVFNNSDISVSLSSDGTVLAIGNPQNGGNGEHAGHVRVYQYIAGTWTQVGTDIEGEAAYDLSGHSISLSANGTVVAIGAPGNDGNGSFAGHVRVYNLSAVLSSDSFVKSNFLVYPNPAANFVTVQLNHALQLEKVNVYSILGHLVKTERNTEISVNELARGSYFIEVITNKGKATKTIIVE